MTVNLYRIYILLVAGFLAVLIACLAGGILMGDMFLMVLSSGAVLLTAFLLCRMIYIRKNDRLAMLNRLKELRRLESEQADRQREREILWLEFDIYDSLRKGRW